MRICIVTPHYPTKEGVGGYFFVEQLVIQFAKLGHQCVVIAPINITSKFFIHLPYGQAHEIRMIDDVYQIEIFRPRYYARNIIINGISWAEWSRQKAIERVIKTNNIVFDLFYCHFFSSATIIWRYATKNHIPLFVASGESTIGSLVKPCRFFTLERFRSTISGVICVSTKNKDEAIGLNYIEESKCVILPNGVDLKLFRPLDKLQCREKLGFRNSEFIVICVGNIVERKGQNRLIAAIEKLNTTKHLNIKLILAGRGEIKQSQCLLYGGFVPHEELPLYLNAADVYAIPTRWEGCCNSIVEAMACCLPIVSSDRSFNWDILNRDNSILIDPDDIDGIAKAIECLYNDPELKKRMGEQSIKTSNYLSIDMRAERILDFIVSSMKV